MRFPDRALDFISPFSVSSRHARRFHMVPAFFTLVTMTLLWSWMWIPWEIAAGQPASEWEDWGMYVTPMTVYTLVLMYSTHLLYYVVFTHISVYSPYFEEGIECGVSSTEMSVRERLIPEAKELLASLKKDFWIRLLKKDFPSYTSLLYEEAEEFCPSELSLTDALLVYLHICEHEKVDSDVLEAYAQNLAERLWGSCLYSESIELLRENNATTNQVYRIQEAMRKI